MKTLLLIPFLFTACAPVHDLMHPWPSSRQIAHDAPVRLFHPNIPTPNGQPHPDWSYALVERMKREDRNPTITALEAMEGSFRAPLLPRKYAPDYLMPLFPLAKK